MHGVKELIVIPVVVVLRTNVCPVDGCRSVTVYILSTPFVSSEGGACHDKVTVEAVAVACSPVAGAVGAIKQEIMKP